MPTPSETQSGNLPPELARYSRQVLYEGIGLAGQRRLLESRVVLIGCGALGGILADTLVRAGVGHLRLCDRDTIEENNLQRQVLFDEDDIRAGRPKAEAAARKLRRINSGVGVEPVVVDVGPDNIETLADGADLILDGTDNFETRFLINDLAVRSGRPWIYGAVVGAGGLCMPILPGVTPCLRCVFESAPPPELSPTCDTAGVIGPAVGMVAAFQAVCALKILSGRPTDVTPGLVSIDAWTGRVTRLNVADADARNACPCCKQRRFDYLDGRATGAATTLCGRDAVQVRPGGIRIANFQAIARKLGPVVSEPVTHNEFMLTARVDGLTLTVFRDGRAIIKGTRTADVARSVYARYIGS